MKYITEYRDKELAKKLVADIAKEARPDRNYRLLRRPYACHQSIRLGRHFA